MLILECPQGYYAVKIWPGELDLWGERSRGHIFTAQYPCEHSRINILQWILTKLGTYLVLRRVWNLIDFQGQRSRLLGKLFTVWTMYVPSLVKIHWRMLILECSQGCHEVKIWPSDLDLWPWKSIRFQILFRTKYVLSLIKIHWRMLILECSQGSGKEWLWWCFCCNL
jgi:hypothetical protein